MSMWVDDMYMSIPFLAQMGDLTGDRKYFDDAAHQVVQYASAADESDHRALRSFVVRARAHRSASSTGAAAPGGR